MGQSLVALNEYLRKATRPDLPDTGPLGADLPGEELEGNNFNELLHDYLKRKEKHDALVHEQAQPKQVEDPERIKEPVPVVTDSEKVNQAGLKERPTAEEKEKARNDGAKYRENQWS